MSRMPVLNSPFLLGFDEIERAVERITRSTSDGYPPYNIERIACGDRPDLLRITLAVAGFTRDQLEVGVENGQLVIKGRQIDDERQRAYLHRGIAARQFQRVFLLADGMEVAGADLTHGLLSVDLHRPEPKREGRVIEIKVRD